MSVRRREPPRVDEAVLKVPGPVLREEGVRAVARAVRESGLRDVRLDLGGVGLVTAGGLGGLVALQRQLRAAGGRLTLCNVRRLVYGEFEVTRLTQVLVVCRKGAGESGCVLGGEAGEGALTGLASPPPSGSLDRVRSRRGV